MFAVEGDLCLSDCGGHRTALKVILSFHFEWFLRVELRLPACSAHCFPKEPSPCPQHYYSLFWAHECVCAHSCMCSVYEGHRTVLGWVVSQTPCSLFIQTRCLTSLELTKESQGSALSCPLAQVALQLHDHYRSLFVLVLEIKPRFSFL